MPAIGEDIACDGEEGGRGTCDRESQCLRSGDKVPAIGGAMSAIEGRVACYREHRRTAQAAATDWASLAGS